MCGGRITTASAIRIPGFIDHVMNKKGEIVRVYLPPDANTLLSVTDHCLRSRNYVNVIVAGKQPALQWLTWRRRSATARSGSASGSSPATIRASEPDVVMACAGDIPDARNAGSGRLAAPAGFRSEDPRGQCGRSDDAAAAERTSARTAGQGFRFALHGGQADHLQLPRLSLADSPAGISQRTNQNLHVRGYKEEGTTTTPFDMCVLNEIDRFNLAIDVIDRVPRLAESGGAPAAGTAE